MNKQLIYILAAVGVLLLIPVQSMATFSSISAMLDTVIPDFESFRSKPYWDVKRWSWGYGTQAPGSTGTITREQALADMKAHYKGDYQYLSPLITRPLAANQWAALLSFSYNAGPGNADNLVANINSGDAAALETQWKKYIYAGGVVVPALIDRRNREWQIWAG